jgi:hypothetical protein
VAGGASVRRPVGSRGLGARPVQPARLRAKGFADGPAFEPDKVHKLQPGPASLHFSRSQPESCDAIWHGLAVCDFSRGLPRSRAVARPTGAVARATVTGRWRRDRGGGAVTRARGRPPSLSSGPKKLKNRAPPTDRRTKLRLYATNVTRFVGHSQFLRFFGGRRGRERRGFRARGFKSRRT